MSVLHTDDASQLKQVSHSPRRHKWRSGAVPVMPGSPVATTKQKQRAQEIKLTGDTEEKRGGEVNGGSHNYTNVDVSEGSGMSPYCQFDKLDRAGAEKLLGDKNKDGMYVIRNGLEGLRVLSVWTKGSCKHYMIYKHDGIFLVKQKLFDNLQELLHYYTNEAYLPQSESNLCHPYHPDDGMIPTLVKSYGMHTSDESSLKDGNDHPLNVGNFPRLRIAFTSAPELLDDKCRHSGWIRKQGGSHKNWKRRYLILRAGCLYYFSSETASSPKGKFVLSGYHVAECPEPKRFRHMFKLEPDDPQARSYVFACIATHELERWKFELEDEINKISQLRIPQLSKSLSMPASPSASINCAKQQSPLLSHRTAGTLPRTNKHRVTPSPVIPRHKAPPARAKRDQGHVYDELDSYQSDSGSYTNVTNSLNSLSYDDPTELLSVDKCDTRVIDDIEDSDSYTEMDGLPIVPNYYNASALITQGGANRSFMQATSQDHNEDKDGYTIIDTGHPLAKVNGTSSVTQSKQKQLQQSPISGVETATNQALLSTSQNSNDDDSGKYVYMSFPTSEELLPPSCVFGQLDRTEADRLLRNKNEEGTYLIHTEPPDSENVLTVWHKKESRHYKLFKHNETYSLTQEKTFNSLPDLIQYYSLQSLLPQSDFCLRFPYTTNN